MEDLTRLVLVNASPSTFIYFIQMTTGSRFCLLYGCLKVCRLRSLLHFNKRQNVVKDDQGHQPSTTVHTQFCGNFSLTCSNFRAEINKPKEYLLFSIFDEMSWISLPVWYKNFEFYSHVFVGFYFSEFSQGCHTADNSPVSFRNDCIL